MEFDNAATDSPILKKGSQTQHYFPHKFPAAPFLAKLKKATTNGSQVQLT